MSLGGHNHQERPLSSPEAINAISRGLHRTAQPLTVLQGILELALLKPHTSEEFQGVIRRAMEQSQRVSDYFDHVRQLVHLQESVPEVSRFSLADMVKSVMCTFTASLAVDGIELQLQLPPNSDGGVFVMAPETRICSALEIIFSNLQDFAGRNTKVDLAIKVRPESVQLELKAARKGVPDSKESAKAAHNHLLDQAQAMVSSAGGSLQLVDRPFAVFMSLPKSQEIKMSESERIECAHV